MKICLIINKNRINSKKVISLIKKSFKDTTIVDVSEDKSELNKVYNKSSFDYLVFF